MVKAVERIRSQAQLFAHEDHERKKAINIESEAYGELKAKRMTQLETMAKHAHEIRFKPLQDILDSLEIEEVLREYFPESAQLVVDSYDWIYRRSVNHKGNKYHRSIIVANTETLDTDHPNLFRISATAEEPPTDPFKTTRTFYTVTIASYSQDLTYRREDRDGLKKLFTQSPKDKPQLITPAENLFTVYLSHDLKTGEIGFYEKEAPHDIEGKKVSYGHYYGMFGFLESLSFDRSLQAIKNFEVILAKALLTKEYQRLYPKS